MFFVKYMVKREFASTWVISQYENRQLQDLGKAFFYNVSQVILKAFTLFLFFVLFFIIYSNYACTIVTNMKENWKLK